jgi:hypothetical protein
MAYASRSGAESLIQGYQYLRREQPLVLGALAVAAGALIGAMIPATRKEDEWIGEHSDQAAERLREQARHAADQAKTTAANAAEAARQAAMSGRGGSETSEQGSQTSASQGGGYGAGGSVPGSP